MKIEIYKSSKDNQWYFRIVAKNGEIVAQSEGYTRKEKAAHTASLIKTQAGAATIQEFPEGE